MTKPESKEVQELELLETPVPMCLFCDEKLDGVIVNGLHERCNEEFQQELDDFDKFMLLVE